MECDSNLVVFSSCESNRYLPVAEQKRYTARQVHPDLQYKARVRFVPQSLDCVTKTLLFECEVAARSAV
eukprot:3937043-Rhodomonas_salina.1